VPVIFWWLSEHCITMNVKHMVWDCKMSMKDVLKTGLLATYSILFDTVSFVQKLNYQQILSNKSYITMTSTDWQFSIARFQELVHPYIVKRCAWKYPPTVHISTVCGWQLLTPSIQVSKLQSPNQSVLQAFDYCWQEYFVGRYHSDWNRDDISWFMSV